MRGGPLPIGRKWKSPAPANEAISRPHTHPSPYGGWNAKGNLANMKPEEAVQMDNIFPGVQAVEMRKGCVEWGYGPPEIINGTFTTNTDGWEAENCNLSIVANELRLTKTTGAASAMLAYQLVELMPGNTYTVTCTETSGSPGTVLKIGAIPGSLSEGWDAGTGALSVTFVAAQVLTYISLVLDPGFGVGNIRSFDDVTFTGQVVGTIQTLLPYHGLTTNKLFAATESTIYEVTTQGVIGAAIVGSFSGGDWISLMMSTSGGNYMFMVNGVNAARVYDGAAFSVPAITVATSSTWSYVTAHKRRIWAIQKDTLDLWYLPVDSIAGAATKFPVGPLFKKGGTLVAIGTWTLDSGSGIDDLFVIVTSKGEIAVYQGTDPASSATWALVAVYEVSKPIGQKPLLDYGGDLLYLGATGVFPLSRLRQGSVVESSSNYSYNVEGAFLDAIDSYSTVRGWQMVTHKSANLLIVNVPTALNTQSHQFVMNTITKKWARFTNWNAACWADFNGELYFACGKSVSKAWIGTTDYNLPIVGVLQQAYSHFGNRSQKKIELTRPNFGITGNVNLVLSFDADYMTFPGDPAELNYIPSGSGSLWDADLWDTATWDGGVSIFEPQWTTVPSNLGYVHSLRLQVTSSSGNFVWTSTDVVMKGAGIL